LCSYKYCWALDSAWFCYLDTVWFLLILLLRIPGQTSVVLIVYILQYWGKTLLNAVLSTLHIPSFSSLPVCGYSTIFPSLFPGHCYLSSFWVVLSLASDNLLTWMHSFVPFWLLRNNVQRNGGFSLCSSLLYGPLCCFHSLTPLTPSSHLTESSEWDLGSPSLCSGLENPLKQ
jgi:hypothetical protein